MIREKKITYNIYIFYLKKKIINKNMHHDDDHEEVDDFFDGPKTFVLISIKK